MATALVVVRHCAAFLLPTDGASGVEQAVRIAVIPLTAMIFGATFSSRARPFARILASTLLLSLAGFVIWFNARSGKPFATEALLLLLPANGMIFPYSMRATLATSGVMVLFYGWIAYVFAVASNVSEAVSGAFYVVAAAAIAAVASRVSYNLREREFRAQRDEHIAHEKAELLLSNTLPLPIVERLRDDPGAIADGHDAVTVLFADIAGFTKLSGQLSPEELVRFSTTFSARSIGSPSATVSRRSRPSATPTWSPAACRSHAPITPAPSRAWRSRCARSRRTPALPTDMSSTCVSGSTPDPWWRV